MKREKTKYPGITFREIPRLDGHGLEKMYYVRYRRGGRGSPETEEPVGRESEGMTAAKANSIRAIRIAGREQTNKERRQTIEAEQRKECQTLKDLWNHYVATLPDNSQYKAVRICRAHYLKPLFAKNINELTTSDIDRFTAKLAKTQGKNNKILAPMTQKHILQLLLYLLRYGERHELCSYPRGLIVTMPKNDNTKTENMTMKQMSAYWKALDEEQNKDVVSILKVALLTGIRRGALLSLQWDDINFEQKTLCLRGETAKNGKTQYIPINDTVIDIFSHITRTDNPLIWPSPMTHERRKNIYTIAKRVRDKAGLPKDFRPLHGLRHTFASHLASSGKVDLYTLQKLLTHSSPQMTQRYAHLADEALRRAAAVADSMVPPPEKA